MGTVKLKRIMLTGFPCALVSFSSLSISSQEIHQTEQVESQETQAAAQEIIRKARTAVSSSAGETEDDSSKEDGWRHNFRRVSDGIYRSGRLDAFELEKLYNMGVKTILNLEGTGDFEKERENIDKIERRRKENHEPDWHIALENVALSGTTAPRFEQLDHALAIAGDHTKYPILIHCKHGEDRTGVVVAAYRTEIEKMSMDDAAKEAKSLHCCHLVIKGGDGLRNFLNKYRQYRSGINSKKE